MNEIQDIMFVFDRCEVENVNLPKFVTDSFNGLPPTSGFEVVAHHIVTLIDEISSLRQEVEALRESRLSDNILKQNNDILQEDILTIKGELRKLNDVIMLKMNHGAVSSINIRRRFHQKSSQRDSAVERKSFHQ